MAVGSETMKQAYRDEVRSQVQRRSGEWDTRARKAARRLLSAVCFRETAESVLRETGSALLPPIAFYYSLYHAVIAALYLDCRTDPRVLDRARHKSVAARLTSNLVKPRLVDSSVADLLQRLRSFREYANYTVGGKLPGDYQYLNAIEDSRRLYKETGQAILNILGFIRAVSRAGQASPSISERIMITIGDDISEDVLQMYLSQADQERVAAYLVTEKLTT